MSINDRQQFDSIKILIYYSMEYIFPYDLYTDNDPYYESMPKDSPFSQDMPSSEYWTSRFERQKIILSNPTPYNLYSEEDPYYNSMPGQSPYKYSLPTSAYWIKYKKNQEIKKIKREQPQTRPFKQDFKIGREILMHLGGASNPEFMQQEDTFSVPKDFIDGSGLAYVLDEQLAKYKPVIKRRDRFVPHEQKVDIIDVFPSKDPIVDTQITFGEARSDLGHSTFCDQKLIETLFNKKELFKPFSESVFQNARKKSNPYETIGRAIFLNRAAVKIANIDYLYNLTNSLDFNKPSFSDVPPNHLFYFADICAGPGGFTDYLYWRLGEDRARGFGMTLAGVGHDWAPDSQFLRDVHTFIRCKGKDDTGNIFKVDNLIEFRNVIERETNGEMVSLVTGDGGIAVDGQENDQEMLLKRLVMCQFFCALTILRKGGNFVCKVFDVLTDFSSSLLYIVAQCFEKFSIVKPYTSRPANNERYCVFLGLREQSPENVINVLSKANDEFQNIENHAQNEIDIMTLFPIDKIPGYFGEYLLKSNEELIKTQIEAVDEFICYAEDQSMKPLDQDNIAKRCLKEWHVPRNKMEDIEVYQKRFRQQQQQWLQRQQQQQQQMLRQQQLQQKMQAKPTSTEYATPEDEGEEREEEVDKRMTSLGLIIMAHKNRMKQQKGEIVKALFKNNGNNQNRSPTFFSFV